jgi:hypothetical protein
MNSASTELKERFDLIQVGGKPATVIGNDLLTGQPAPHFRVRAGAWPGRDLWSEFDPYEEVIALAKSRQAKPRAA